jgi:hypothetical protein
MSSFLDWNWNSKLVLRWVLVGYRSTKISCISGLCQACIELMASYERAGAVATALDLVTALAESPQGRPAAQLLHDEGGMEVLERALLVAGAALMASDADAVWINCAGDAIDETEMLRNRCALARGFCWRGVGLVWTCIWDVALGVWRWFGFDLHRGCGSRVGAGQALWKFDCFLN